VRRLPDGLQVPRLRDRLAVLVAESRAGLRLQRAAGEVLRADCLDLADRLYA
jgi:hypothetical protein